MAKRRRRSGRRASGSGEYCMMIRKTGKGGKKLASTRCYSNKVKLQAAIKRAAQKDVSANKAVMFYKRGG